MSASACTRSMPGYVIVHSLDRRLTGAEQNSLERTSIVTSYVRIQQDGNCLRKPKMQMLQEVSEDIVKKIYTT